MPYLLLDDDFTEHPKIRPLSDKAFRLHVKALCHAAKWRTDGRIPPDLTRSNTLVSELEKARLWERNGDGLLIHGFLERNPAAAETDAARERSKAGNATGGSIGNHRRWHAARGLTSPDCRWCHP